MSRPSRRGPAAPMAAERSSLERLRLLLIEEGGLMASLAAASVPTDLPEREGPARTIAEGPRAEGPAQIAAAGPRAEATVQIAAAGPRADGPAQIAAAGPRAEGRREEYELSIEAIYEGYLLHYGKPRVAHVPARERDLGLLAGDRLYALGLARLVALGDVAAVAELADTITLSALAQGAGAPELADAVWAAGARAIGWGSSAAHRHAKQLALAGSPEAIEAMRTSAEGVLASR